MQDAMRGLTVSLISWAAIAVALVVIVGLI